MLLPFLFVDLYFLIPAVTTQMCTPISELKISIEIPTTEATAEVEIHPVIVEIIISMCSI